MTKPVEISQLTARRFILGTHGLWPSRRWSGTDGAEQAMRSIEHLQLDPLDIGARAHDLILHSRVQGYKKSDYDQLTYGDKKFFEWGGWLATRPMEEWPYWQVVRDRANQRYKRWIGNAKPKVLDQVLKILEAEGPKMNRQIQGNKIEKTYRGGKESSVALYQLWLRGDVVTCGRHRFERVYDLASRHVPEKLMFKAPTLEAELFLIEKWVGFHSLAPTPITGITGLLYREVSAKEQAQLLNLLVEQKRIFPVKIQGWKKLHYVRTKFLPMLEALESGFVPQQWTSPQAVQKNPGLLLKKNSIPTEGSEVLFLSPLEPVSARGRSKIIFDFEYIWEVYKPEHLRKWGYYVLPMLWGDQLVGRIEPVLDKKKGKLVRKKIWYEDSKLKKNTDFQSALKTAEAELENLFLMTNTYNERNNLIYNKK